MDKIIGVTELQRNFRAVFEQVVRERTPYVLTRGSRPEAVMIPYDQYVKFIQANEKDVLWRFDETMERLAERNAKFTEAEVERDVLEAEREVNRQRIARERTVPYKVGKGKRRVVKLRKQ